jgi:predicted transcriptional regulator
MEENTKRRDRLSIMADILEIAQRGALKTQIMYKANLSFTQLNDYLDYLRNANLLTDCKTNGKEIYLATEKGVNFIKCYYELTDLVKIQTQKNGAKLPPRKF